MTRYTASLLVLAVVATSALATRPIRTQRVTTTTRTWQQGRWLPAGALMADGTVLVHPWTIALGPNALYVFDGGDRTLKAFTLDGRPLWRYGPTAGRTPFDPDERIALAVDHAGRVWAADGNAGRITVLSSSGAVVDTIPLIRPTARIAIRPDGSFWASTSLSAAPVLCDARGNRVRTLSLPRALAPPSHAIGEADLHVASGDTLIVAYDWAGDFLVAHGTHGGIRLVRAVEPRPFGQFVRQTYHIGVRDVTAYKPDSSARLATLSSAVDNGLLFALYSNEDGVPADRYRTLDIYRIADGRYLGSRRLPLAAVAIAVQDSLVYAIGHDGSLRVWRWVAE